MVSIWDRWGWGTIPTIRYGMVFQWDIPWYGISMGYSISLIPCHSYFMMTRMMSRTLDPSRRDLGYSSSMLPTRSVMFYNQNSPKMWVHRVQSSTSALTRRDNLIDLLLHGPASVFNLSPARACELSLHIAKFPSLSTTAGHSNNL